MAPPLVLEVPKRKNARIKKKPELSAIKEEDENKKANEEISTIYVSPEQSKAKKTTLSVPKVKKVSKSPTSKIPLAKAANPQEQNAETHAKAKRKVSRNKAKSEMPMAQVLGIDKEVPMVSKYKTMMRYSYTPVVRSFIDSDLTSLPIDDIVAKRPYLAKNDSRLPKPVSKAPTKKKKKTTKDIEAAKTVPAAKTDKVLKKSTKETKTSGSKKQKVKKNVSKIPKKISKVKRVSNEKKIVAKIPLA